MITIAGMPIVDATKPFALTVKAEDVKTSRRKDADKCVVARACLHVPGVTAAKVHLTRTYLLVDKKWMRYLTPINLRTEIVGFDRGAKFQTGQYTLLPAPEGRKLGFNYVRSTKTKKPSGTNKPRKQRQLLGVRSSAHSEMQK